MTTYDRIVNQTQENLERTTRRWTDAQEQTVAFADEAAKRLRGVLPIATQAVETNYRLISEALQLQRDLTVRWLETFESAPANPGRGSGKSS
jgi:hypothetical protein